MVDITAIERTLQPVTLKNYTLPQIDDQWKVETNVEDSSVMKNRNVFFSRQSSRNLKLNLSFCRCYVVARNAMPKSSFPPTSLGKLREVS